MQTCLETSQLVTIIFVSIFGTLVIIIGILLLVWYIARRNSSFLSYATKIIGLPSEKEWTHSKNNDASGTKGEFITSNYGRKASIQINKIADEKDGAVSGNMLKCPSSVSDGEQQKQQCFDHQKQDNVVDQEKTQTQSGKTGTENRNELTAPEETTAENQNECNADCIGNSPETSSPREVTKHIADGTTRKCAMSEVIECCSSDIVDGNRNKSSYYYVENELKEEKNARNNDGKNTNNSYAKTLKSDEKINDANGIHLFQNGHNYGYTNGYVDVPLGEMPIRQDYSPSNKFTDLTQDQYNTLKHNASRLEKERKELHELGVI